MSIPHTGSLVSRVVTISLGLAGITEGQRSAESLFAAADRALYMAKKSGRNKVVVFDQNPDDNAAKELDYK